MLTGFRDLRYPLGVGSFVTKAQKTVEGDLRLSVEIEALHKFCPQLRDRA